uniref:AIG1-type G domain-containing protein n=1 Tax=Neogobius melanostomus TaxID=47308 RepID=A0A8C6S8R8_9GOBI
MDRDFSRYISESVKLDDGPPARYQLRTKIINLDRLLDEESRLRKFTVGKRDHKHPNKTVLLVGATGSGKSTLINALVNFVMGVTFEDKVWFEIVTDEKNKPQVDSQTSAVSIYEVFGFEGKTVPYSLTIIDTPGYGDTRGIEYDDIITKKLQDLFCVPDEVDSIDAVGLVLKSTENRLDERMAYIFNSVTSLFGRDMEQNIVALMTYSDGMKPKDGLQALDEVKVKCARNENNEPVYFCFNNRQKDQLEEGSDDQAARFAFQISGNGMKKFTAFLGERPPQSLKTTLEVMKERIRLTACIQNLEERVRTIELKQNAVKKNKEELSKYEEDMKKNKDFTIHEEEVYREKEKIKSAGFWADNRATTCNKCKENCHYPGCTWAWGPSWCEVMEKRRCTSCSGKCPLFLHYIF